MNFRQWWKAWRQPREQPAPLRLVLTPEAAERVDDLRRRSGLANVSDVIRSALACFTLLIDHVAKGDGHVILLRSPGQPDKELRCVPEDLG